MGRVDEELQEGSQSFVVDRQLKSVTLPNETVQSELITLTDFTVIRVGIGNDIRFAVSFDNSAGVETPGFSQTLCTVLEAADDEEYRHYSLF